MLSYGIWILDPMLTAVGVIWYLAWEILESPSHTNPPQKER